MSELAFLIVGVLIGFYERKLRDRLKALEQFIQTPTRTEPTEGPKSLMVEPMTPEQEAAREMADRVKRLNS